jgi:hypothetical protein
MLLPELGCSIRKQYRSNSGHRDVADHARESFCAVAYAGRIAMRPASANPTNRSAATGSFAMASFLTLGPPNPRSELRRSGRGQDAALCSVSTIQITSLMAGSSGHGVQKKQRTIAYRPRTALFDQCHCAVTASMVTTMRAGDRKTVSATVGAQSSQRAFPTRFARGKGGG